MNVHVSESSLDLEANYKKTHSKHCRGFRSAVLTMDYSSSMPEAFPWTDLKASGRDTIRSRQSLRESSRAMTMSSEESDDYDVDHDLLIQGHSPEIRVAVENMLQSICLIIYDIYNRSVQLTETIDSSTAIKKYTQRTKLSVPELQSRLRHALDKLIEFVEKVDDEHRAFLKLPSYTESVILEASSIPIFKQVWFGDYFEATGLDSLVALKAHLVGIHDQLDVGQLVKKIEKSRD